MPEEKKPSTLTPDIQRGLFDLMDGLQRKEEGMAKAAEARPGPLELARQLARDVALTRSSREVTMDDVRYKLFQLGHGQDFLGNAAGSVFLHPWFEFTGKRVRSRYPQNHGRELKVWRLGPA